MFHPPPQVILLVCLVALPHLILLQQHFKHQMMVEWIHCLAPEIMIQTMLEVETQVLQVQCKFSNTGRPPYLRFQLSAVYHSLKKFGKLKKKMVHKFRNVRQVRMGHKMVKSSSPNLPSTWLIFLCPHTHASPQTFHHSASSVLPVRISCRVIALFVFRKQQEEWRSQWVPTIG